MAGTGIEATQANQIVADDAFPGIEDQHDQRFFHRIVPVSFGDVLPPIPGHLLRIIQQFGHGFAFPQIQDFKFLWCILFDHENGKGRTPVKMPGQ